MSETYPGVSHHDYSNASRYCDVVMKGGITSGILYPPCVCELARDYHFKSIGGTSAGAIAAVLTAAAEYRRRQGSDEGFRLLEKIPKELGESGHLLQLFRPDRSTRKIFRDFLAVQDAPGFKKLLQLWRLPGLLLRRPFTRLVGNDYGLCSGMARGNLDGASYPPLGHWLTDSIDRVAGLDDDERPLTFGDLWQTKDPIAITQRGEPRGIHLRTVTTCLTHRRPYAIPFRDQLFSFHPAEWRRIFPERIVRFMEAHPRREREEKDGELVPMPAPENLPVVVAARMSLSFPGLLTMVPLWAVDYELDEPKATRCWFSDGGITSNFPMHFFDSLAPRWPTFGINLQYMAKDAKPGRRRLRRETPAGRIWIPQRRQSGLAELFNDFDPESKPRSRYFSFLGAIFSSAQSWYDNAYLRLPAYRERVVEIWLSEPEGGMNLDMPSSVITNLIGYGAEAGRQLRRQFSEQPSSDVMGWEAHRWARFRSGLAALAETLGGLKVAFEDTLPGDRSFRELMLRGKDESPPSYRFKGKRQGVEQKDAAVKALDDLLVAVTEWQQWQCSEEPEHGPFCEPPQPPIRLGSRPTM